MINLIVKKRGHNLNLICSAEKTQCHFDRSDEKHRVAEKSIQKKISRLAFGSLEMTTLDIFYKAKSIINHSKQSCYHT